MIISIPSIPKYVTLQCLDIKPNKESWAVDTGAAMGIGKHYGLELAKKGFSIVIIDKDEDGTEKTRRELVMSGVKVIKDINLIFLSFTPMVIYLKMYR